MKRVDYNGTTSMPCHWRKIACDFFFDFQARWWKIACDFIPFLAPGGLLSCTEKYSDLRIPISDHPFEPKTISPLDQSVAHPSITWTLSFAGFDSWRRDSLLLSVLSLFFFSLFFLFDFFVLWKFRNQSRWSLFAEGGLICSPCIRVSSANRASGESSKKQYTTAA